ncbi:MAG: ABC transporter permease [Lachnospiraceae bacterium]|nr:ABC transporter permease [Lachnospiraceae bacterium]MDD3794555.1 ABC transporter permease [Lachnospiraceae bacterium]
MKNKRDGNMKSKIYSVANSMGAWLIILILIVIMSFINSKFLSVSNFINVFRQVCVVGICALGVSFVVLGGEIDLSSGMGATFAGCNAALLITKCNVPMWIAILIAVAVGALVGAFSGFIVTYWRIPSFIGTLGVQYIVQGLVLITTNSMPVTNLPDGFLFLGRGYIANIIPVPVIIMIIFFGVGAFLLKYTPFGRSVIAVGENAEAASLSGLKVNLTKMLMFTLGGLCAACAGIVMTARLSSGQPSSGADLGLQALAAVYIGGTFKGSMFNTLAGALVWGFINNSLNLLGVSAYWQKVVLGAIIILAVLLDAIRARVSAAK